MKKALICRIMVLTSLLVLFTFTIAADADTLESGPYYIGGVISRPDRSLVNGTLYIWYDNNSDGIVNHHDGELETVEVVDNIYQSKSRYGAGLEVVLQTHTEGDYITTVTHIVEPVMFNSLGVLIMPEIAVRCRDPTPIFRALSAEGWDYLDDNFTINPVNYIQFSFHADGYLSLGQEPYTDLVDVRGVGDWALCIYVENHNFFTDTYDCLINSATGIYYYYYLDPIDGDPNVFGSFYSISITFEILGNIDIYIQIYDPTWYYTEWVPIYQKPSEPAFSITEYNSTPMGGIEYIYEAARVEDYPGGSVFVGEVEGRKPDSGGGAVIIPDPLEIVEFVGPYIYEFPYPIPLIFMMYYLTMHNKQFRRTFLRAVIKTSRSHRRRHMKSGHIARATPNPESIKTTVPETKTDYADIVGSRRGYRHIEDVPRDPYLSLETAQPEHVETIAVDTHVRHIPPPPNLIIAKVECKECGASIRKDELQYDSKIGTYWICESCVTMNIIGGTK